MGRMNDEDVSRLLRELPREEPSSDFTARVLAKVDARSRGGRLREATASLAEAPRAKAGRRNRVPALAWVGAALVGLFLCQGYLRERYQRSKAAARVRELRDEYRELQTELEKIRTLTRELEPVLDLGGTGDVEFVFDLRELAREEANGSRATPASHAP